MDLTWPQAFVISVVLFLLFAGYCWSKVVSNLVTDFPGTKQSRDRINRLEEQVKLLRWHLDELRKKVKDDGLRFQ